MSLRRLRFAIEAAGFAGAAFLGRALPLAALSAAGALAGRLAHLLDRRHRRIARDNLASALGAQLRPGQARRIVGGCFAHFGRITFEALGFARLGPADIGRVVRYEGLEHIRAAYAGGKGVLLFSGHFGHWELIALMQGFLGLRLHLVARPLDNRALERQLARLRGRSGNGLIHKRLAARRILQVLRSGEGVAIVLDQDARRTGVFVPFFGRPASTTPTLALMALRTGAAIVPTYSIPLGRGRYRVVYEPAIAVRPSGDLDRDVLELTATCTGRIEAWVRERPELWLWMHRRWKTAPPGPSGARPPGDPPPGERERVPCRAEP
jgi:KDO2-lipid IV(A) lauroyltransferase